jgi:hypothetical protein
VCREKVFCQPEPVKADQLATNHEAVSDSLPAGQDLQCLEVKNKNKGPAVDCYSFSIVESYNSTSRITETSVQNCHQQDSLVTLPSDL